MDKKKIGLGAAAANAGKSAKAMVSKARSAAVKVLDKNEDGSFNRDDISAIAGAVGTSAKHAATAVKDCAEAKSREIDLKNLQPIFPEDLQSADFLLPKLIRIVELDKKRAESEVCKGSIGYTSIQKDLRVVNIYQDNVNDFGLTFYPDNDYGVYYVDPSDRDRYISLDDYFSYLKVARVNELQKIAQDLGAKHFKVTYKEQKTTFAQKAVKVKVNAKAAKDSATADIQHDLSSSDIATVEIAAEMECIGHNPSEPKLHYLKHESSIQTLVSLRMNKDAPLTHQKYTLKLSNSSGIKENDAVKIDAALKSMKLSGNTTVANEARNEARRFFEYEIDF